MNNPLILCCLLAVATLVSGHPEWDTFKRTHGKKYKSALEESLRKTIFLQNKEKVERFNEEDAHKAGFTMGLNHLSDLTDDEFAKISRGFKNPQHTLKNSIEASNYFDQLLGSTKSEIPESVDWRQVEGRVTTVKNQGICGCSWAFSATGALEGQMSLRNVTLEALSEQNLVDCSKRNLGCDGGHMYRAWEDIQKQGGIEAERDYQYTGVQGDCKFNKTLSKFNDKSAFFLTHGDEEMLKRTVAVTVVSVVIDARPFGFRHYKSGIFYDENCSSLYFLDHAMLVVGYGENEDGKYWIVKNSWSGSWGEEGFIRMARDRGNHCGIASLAMIPTFEN